MLMHALKKGKKTKASVSEIAYRKFYEPDGWEITKTWGKPMATSAPGTPVPPSPAFVPPQVLEALKSPVASAAGVVDPMASPDEEPITVEDLQEVTERPKRAYNKKPK